MAAPMHPSLSVHQVCFGDLALPAAVRRSAALGARRMTLLGNALLEEGAVPSARAALAGEGVEAQSIAHLFHTGGLSADRASWQPSRDSLDRLIDAAAELGAPSIYLLTGGHGGLAWEQAAECFAGAIAPCVERARGAGVALAIENASALYADLHIAHTLVDTIALAERARIGVCVELFFCWAESDLAALLARAVPLCTLVQVSDYVLGDRALPGRAVPGDGAIPLAQLLAALLDAGYAGAFELELLGPRIDAEGAASAVARGAAYLGELLAELRA